MLSLPQYKNESNAQNLTSDTYHKHNWKKLLTLSLLIMFSVAFTVRKGLTGRIGFKFPPFGCGHHTQQGLGGLPMHYNLSSGSQIPSVALGVWRAPKDKTAAAVKTALKSGYRHIDGAWIYRNEEEVGQALKESGVKREDVWLTSKLWNTFHAPEDVEPALDDSLQKLGTDYLDLYIIHWPLAVPKDGKPADYDKELTANPYPTWQKLEEMVEKGKVRNIGVSNFNIRRLQNLTANPLKIQPAVNQVEINFWFPQVELLEFSRQTGILLEAYSPLGSAERVKDSLNVPEIKEVARMLEMTPAQVIISWHIQRGTIVLPKSETPSRVTENIHLKKLPEAAFEKIEKAVRSHKPERGSNPSKNWGLDFDIFE
ncbi:NADP-dependent oxidoreductase domain-containing protein [Lentinula edodes]|uniref:NADP-dependent oxidoreductase domain-containing protein n=1 Tax=Lentinula edodes TaxID=5353 RepID=UPI001E8EBCDC|nr:NADP-dependent oxidoreductase domain-containing protein [Lentinula edodes]KAH7874220.1 NADP-dependent oxidoreductase domain-containing protein [Lentinula edodes]